MHLFEEEKGIHTPWWKEWIIYPVVGFFIVLFISFVFGGVAIGFTSLAHAVTKPVTHHKYNF